MLARKYPNKLLLPVGYIHEQVEYKVTGSFPTIQLAAYARKYPTATLVVGLWGTGGSGAANMGLGRATGGAGGGFAEARIPLSRISKSSAYVTGSLGVPGAAVSVNTLNTAINGIAGATSTCSINTGMGVSTFIHLEATGGEGGIGNALDSGAAISRNNGGRGRVMSGNYPTGIVEDTLCLPGSFGAGSGLYLVAGWQGSGKAINGGGPGGDIWVFNGSDPNFFSQNGGDGTITGGIGGESRAQHYSFGLTAIGDNGQDGGGGGGAAGVLYLGTPGTATSGSGGKGRIRVSVVEGLILDSNIAI